jgi:ketosteroid isomerase-like protein
VPGELDLFIEQHHGALARFVLGDAEPLKALLSRAKDVTLANPFGGVVRGWEQAAARMESAASFYSDGEVLGFEMHAMHVGADLACLVEGESYRVKIRGGHDPADVRLRVTSVLRHENGGWRLVHRHADPITTARPDESYVKPG